MRYQGSKKKLSKTINELVSIGSKNCSVYVEPFCGGANSLSAVNFPMKLTCDANKYIIALWNDVKNGTFGNDKQDFVKNLSKEQYYGVKLDYETNGGKYSDSVIGYVGSACSYGGSWWNGYANYNPNKHENHILEAYNGFSKQIKGFNHLSNTTFINCDYKSIMDHVTENAFIYCDPPYGSTKGYKTDFNTEEFWKWCREMVNKGHVLMVSEYNAPDDFVPIYQKKMQDGMSSGNGEKNEKIFVMDKQMKLFV